MSSDSRNTILRANPVIILGSTGMLGRYISYHLGSSNECICLNRKHFNAVDLNRSFFVDLIREGDIVINCVGILKPHISKTGALNTIKINSVFPQLIADICEEKKSQMIHISSDCVFSGRKGLYTENEPCDANDLYGKTKSLEPDNAITLRTSFIGEEVNPNGVGLLQWILSQRGKEISGYDNCIWNGVTCLQLAKVINRLINRTDTENGIRHVFSPEPVTKYALCNIVNETYNLGIKVNKVSAEEIEGTKIEGTLDRSLSSIHTDLFTICPPIKDQIINQRDEKPGMRVYDSNSGLEARYDQ